MSENQIIDGVNYGPLAPLIGEWRGDKGMDVAPEPDGAEQNPYYERITFEAIGDVTNAERQTLSALRYHQVVSRKSDDGVFHNETGYWLWDANDAVVVQTLTIPRGVSLVAGGVYPAASRVNEATLTVQARAGDPDWGIVQSPFMRDNARTVGFTHSIEVSGDRLVYSEATELEIYGRTFVHTDQNTLARAG